MADAPVIEAPKVETPVVVEKAPESDLITKVTQFKRKETPPEGDTYKDFADIPDPKAREIAINRDKQRQADYTRKTQELAQQRKELEEKQKPQKWSAERIQNELLNDQEFLNAAQQISQNPPNSGLTDQEFSALTEGEKKEIASLKSEVTQLKQSNLRTSIQAEVSQTDAQLRAKYADYDPNEINSSTEALGKMNLSNIREYVYKATLHDQHVKDAYELGRQEALQFNREKIGAISPDGVNTNANDSAPAKNKGESDTAYFVRLAQARAAQFRKK